MTADPTLSAILSAEGPLIKKIFAVVSMAYLNVKINRWHCYQKFSFLYLEWRNPEPSFRPFRGVGFSLTESLIHLIHTVEDSSNLGTERNVERDVAGFSSQEAVLLLNGPIKRSLH